MKSNDSSSKEIILRYYVRILSVISGQRPILPFVCREKVIRSIMSSIGRVSTGTVHGSTGNSTQNSQQNIEMKLSKEVARDISKYFCNISQCTPEEVLEAHIACHERQSTALTATTQKSTGNKNNTDSSNNNNNNNNSGNNNDPNQNDNKIIESNINSSNTNTENEVATDIQQISLTAMEIIWFVNCLSQQTNIDMASHLGKTINWNTIV